MHIQQQAVAHDVPMARKTLSKTWYYHHKSCKINCQNNLLFLVLHLFGFLLIQNDTFWCVLEKKQILLEQNSKIQTSNVKLNKDPKFLLNLFRALLASYMNWIFISRRFYFVVRMPLFLSYLMNWMLLAPALCSRSGSGDGMFGST